jgi:hypothetical protein
MAARREAAEAEARRRFPGLRDLMVCFGHGRCVVEVKDKDGHWRRFEHYDSEDEVLAVQAEQQTQRREVIHG